jgi:hypothetical protein
VNGAAWGALGSVAGALIIFLGTRYTARAAKSASQYTAALNAPQGISTGYALLTDDLWENIRDLRGRVRALEEAAEVHNRKYRAAIGYVRALLSHITIHAPATVPPAPPPELREDVRIHTLSGEEPT